MIVDVNTGLGHWPFARFLPDTAAKLARHLAREGVDLALVSAIDSALFPDPHLCNLELMEALAPFPSLVPLMTIDPSLGHWHDCLTRYRATDALNAVRILPNYHRYPLGAGFVDELARRLADDRPRGVLVIQMRVDDERNQYPLMQVPGVPVDEVTALARRIPHLPMLCLCAYRHEAIRLIRETENVSVDIAFVEHLDTLAGLLREAPAGRVLFGSHTPFLYTRATVMKLECSSIDDDAKQAVGSANAITLFAADKLDFRNSLEIAVNG